MACNTALRDALVSCVKRMTGGKDVAVACSGGLDSGLVACLATRFARSVTLYTCGTPRSFDVANGRDLAGRLGVPWVLAGISKGNVPAYVGELSKACNTEDPFTISYELQLFSVCKLAREAVVLTGQGSDEYFMGCAKFVGASDHDFMVLQQAAKDRLNGVSVPCERRIAKHFGKELLYPYMDPEVQAEISRIDVLSMRPKDMGSRKSVLKEVAVDLGYGFLAERTKKSSQYGSGTTDIIRGMAREKGMRYNEYVLVLCDRAAEGKPPVDRGALVEARIDPAVKAEAEAIFAKEGTTPSRAIESFYRSVIEKHREG